MEETICTLQRDLYEISMNYLMDYNRNNVKAIKEHIPQIEEFATWFLEENRYGIEENLYQDLCRNLLMVLQDISAALQQEDRVLLHDAVGYGLLEYLKLFVVQEEAADECL